MINEYPEDYECEGQMSIEEWVKENEVRECLEEFTYREKSQEIPTTWKISAE